MRKIFVTGAAGQLGSDVVREARRRGYEAAASARAVPPGAAAGAPGISSCLDITDREAVLRTIGQASPDCVIHCAAWTAVDAAEKAENRARVDAVNRLGTRYVAEAAAAAGAKMIYISTDYVFDGQGERPWRPEDPAPAPLNVYGETKLAGEREVRALLSDFFIVRVSWVFGPKGENFVKTMLRAGGKHGSVRVVNDQIGTPTYTRDLSRLLIDMAETEKYGVYHAANSECAPGAYISWYDFAKEIFRYSGTDASVIPVTTEEYGLTGAARPRNSRLDKSKLAAAGFTPLPAWDDALHRFLRELGAVKAPSPEA